MDQMKKLEDEKKNKVPSVEQDFNYKKLEAEMKKINEKQLEEYKKN